MEGAPFRGRGARARGGAFFEEEGALFYGGALRVLIHAHVGDWAWAPNQTRDR